MPFEDLKALIASRRTVKDFDGRAVSEDIVSSLLELAVCAPNHHRNAPWFFRIMMQESVRRWVQSLKAELSESDFTPLQKTIQKLEKVGAIIHVSSRQDAAAHVTRENYAACAAATYALMLGARAFGLHSFWSTSKICDLRETRHFLSVKDDEDLVGMIWLGYGTAPMAPARVPPTERSQWFHT